MMFRISLPSFLRGAMLSLLILALACDKPSYVKPNSTVTPTNTVAPVDMKDLPTITAEWEQRKVSGQTPLEQLIDKADYERLFPHRMDPAGHDPQGTYYTWENLVNASRYFPKFLNEGTREDRFRELAAFFGNKAQEVGITKGPLEVGADAEVRYSYGLGYIVEIAALPVGANIAANPSLLYKAYYPNYLDDGSGQYPVVAGQSYHGRGPLQLSHPVNYGQMSERFFGDKNILLKNPPLIAQNGFLGWLSAIWFWMEPQNPKPSCHDVMVGNVNLVEPYTPPTVQSRAPRAYDPSSKGSDAAGKTISYAGFPARNGLEVGIGMTFNIINGLYEADYGQSMKTQVARRLVYYARYLDYFGIQKQGRDDKKAFPISPQVGGKGGDPVPEATVALFRNWRNWNALPGSIPPEEQYFTPDKYFPAASIPSVLSAAYQSRLGGG